MALKNELHPLMNIFLLGIYILMVVYTGWQLISSLDLKYNASSAQGVITGYYTRTGNAKFIWNRKPEYAPVISFLTAEAEEIEVVTTTFKKRMKYEKGDAVTVFYYSKSPKKAQIDNSFPWVRNSVLFLAGIIGLFYTLSPIFHYKI